MQILTVPALRPVLAAALLAALRVATPAPAATLFGADDENLYTLDTATGVSTLVGPHGATPFLGGLEWADGTLYAISAGPASLYTVNVATGEATPVGTLGVGIAFEGGLAWDGQTMWAVNQGSLAVPNLLTIDLATGDASIVGRIGPAGGSHDFNGLAWHDGALYGIDAVTNALWRIDTANPQASTMVGTGLGGGTVAGVTGGMAGEFVYASGTNALITVDFTTGVGTFVSTPDMPFTALAPVPEPATLALLAVAAALVRRR